jgi:hypothetical protein
VLAAIMRELNLNAAGYRRLELSAPWGIDFDQAGVRGIHIVLEGRCVAAFGRKAMALESGDMVIAPRADRHVLRSPGAPASVVKPAKRLVSIGGRVKSGGKGEKAIVLCGAFAFSEASHPALSGLPRFVHIRGEGGGDHHAGVAAYRGCWRKGMAARARRSCGGEGAGAHP